MSLSEVVKHNCELLVYLPGAQCHSLQIHHVCQRNDGQTKSVLKDHRTKYKVNSVYVRCHLNVGCSIIPIGLPMALSCFWSLMNGLCRTEAPVL